MNLFQILEGCTAEMETLVNVVNFILNLIRWAVPLVLLVLGSIDLFKAMANSDEKMAKEARKTIIRRLIYGVAIFLLVWAIKLVFSIVGNAFNNDDLRNATNSDFFSCWSGTFSSSSNGGSSKNQESTTCTCKHDGSVTTGVKRSACYDKNLWNGECLD